MRIRLVALLTLTLAAAPGLAATPAKILVYTGNSALISGFTLFSGASGRALDERDSLPGDLSAFACVILPSNDAPFTSTMLTKLSNYVKGGGRLFALGDGSIFRGPNANMNALAAAMGSTMSLTPADIDIGFHTTTNIDPSPLTIGATSIVYAFTSKIEPSSGASLFRTAAEGSTDVIAAAETVGSGVFVLSGDSNVWSDSSGGGYTSHDNGIVPRNLCGLWTTLVAEPAIADVDAGEVNLSFTATLTEFESGSPLPLREITFSVGGTAVCSAITDAGGTATCGGPTDAIDAALASGYDATYAGGGPYSSSTDHGAVIHALDMDLL